MPGATRVIACLLAALPGALSAGLRAQETPPAPTPGDLLARCRQLDEAARSEVLRNLERRLARENHDVLQSIQSLQKGRAAYPARSPERWFDPREFAPAAAPRTLVAPSAAGHRRLTAGMQPFVLLPDLACSVGYDWQQGAAVRGDAELGPDQRLANLAHGYAPGADQALAQVLAAIDQDPTQRRLADYFEHRYADRDGAVFAGVSLYDAWRSGRKLEMPDTDAIAYARLLLGTQAYTSPIPADRRRQRLYEKMAAGFAAHHEHRTLCQALAATFLAAEPALDPSWQALVDRCHWLWQTHGRDPAAVAQHLRRAADRSALLQEVDAAMARDFDPVRRHRNALAELAAFLRQCLDQELRAAGV